MSAPPAAPPRATRRILGLRLATVRDRRRATLARGRRPRLDARRHGRDALLHGARTPDARPGDGQGHGRSPELADPAGLGDRWPALRLPGRPGRAHALADALDPRLLAGERGVRPLHHRRPAGRLPVHPRPGHGRRVDDRRRPHRRDLARGAPRQGPGPDAVHLGHRRDDRGRCRRSRPAELRLARRLLRGVLPAAHRVLDPPRRARVRDLAAPPRERHARLAATAVAQGPPAERARGHRHERLRDVRLLGPLHLDPRLPLAARSSRAGAASTS